METGGTHETVYFQQSVISEWAKLFSESEAG